MGFGFDFEPQQTLASIVERLDKAAADETVAAIVLTFDDVRMGWAQMQELRAAVEAVRAAGKDVQAMRSTSWLPPPRESACLKPANCN